MVTRSLVMVSVYPSLPNVLSADVVKKIPDSGAFSLVFNDRLKPVPLFNISARYCPTGWMSAPEIVMVVSFVSSNAFPSRTTESGIGITF